MGMLCCGGFPAQSFLCIPAYAGAGLWEGMCIGPCSSSWPANCAGCSLPGDTGCGRLEGGVGRTCARGTVFLRAGGCPEAARFGAAFFFAGFFCTVCLVAFFAAGFFFDEAFFFAMA